ncbi:MAG: helix-turn-helix transcriptional regulator [Eubacterium sp.]|nr:helix-turn-helix transcriptional regulator [Eubacterium sp.]
MSIYDRIKSKADEKKISIKALERESGLGNGVIKRWNETSPQCNKLEKVANYLQVSIEWLITGKENRDLSDEENAIIVAYKNATPAIQEAVQKLLDVSNKDEKSSNLKIG